MHPNESNNHESNPLELRIAIGTVLVSVGINLGGKAVDRMLSSESWPQSIVLLLVLGGIILIAGLLILIVPYKHWKHVWPSIIGFPGWIRRACIWWFRGPKWSVPKPIISIDEITPMAIGECGYTTTLSLVIKNRDTYLLEGALYSLTVNIEQRLGRMPVRCFLRPNPSYQIQIQPHQEETYKLSLFGKCSSARCLDVKKDFNWGIEGILVGLNGVGNKELHRGLYFKLSSQKRVGF